MEFTEVHAGQIQETHDAIIELKPMIKAHNKTLYGNAQPGLVKEVERLKTVNKSKKGNAQFIVTIILCIVAVLSAIAAWVK